MRPGRSCPRFRARSAWNGSGGHDEHGPHPRARAQGRALGLCRAARALAHHRTCGLRATGLVAPLVLDGAGNGAAFLACVRQFLAPTLSPGDIVVLDNLSAHKASGVREALGACGAALLYLPPYGPDLNPIERVFSKLKRLPRDAAERTIEELWQAIARLLSRFSPRACANYIRHPGFAQSGL